jgi:hypothetical protein
MGEIQSASSPPSRGASSASETREGIEMFTIEMLPARNGDALWIEYGDANRPNRVLIDGGTPGTRPVLEERIGALPEGDRHFELLVVTHIDSDHIGGILGLLEKRRVEITVGDVWFNGWRHLPETPLESLGPVQGERLTKCLIGPPARPWNEHFDGGPVEIPIDGSRPEAIQLPGGLHVTVLSPGRKELWVLKKEWQRVLGKAGLDPNLAPPGEPEALAPGLERLGPPPLPDVAALAAVESRTDDTEANGSSIVVLAEFDNRRALLAGDAHPDVLIRGIDSLVGLGGALDADVFKVPHHGSQFNVTTEMLRRVVTHRYLFSTDGTGNGFSHPDPQAIAKVLANGQPEELWFNYRTERNRIWGDGRLESRYGYKAHFREEPNRMVVTV